MHCGMKTGQLRRWNSEAKRWFTDKHRDTFVVMNYTAFPAAFAIYEPGYDGSSSYTPEYLSASSHEVVDGEG